MNQGSKNRPVIAAIGDFMIAKRPAPDAVESTRDLLDGVDLVVANIDTVLSAEGTPTPKWANLRGPREAANDLRALGVDVAIMANNHAMDFRAPGMLDSRRAFEEAGIVPVGAGHDLTEATQPVFVDRGGVRIAVLAVSCTLPVESAAGTSWPGIAPVRVHYAFEVDESLFAEQPGTVPVVRSWIDEEDLERVRADIAKADTQADVVLTFVHWGVPRPWRAPFHDIVQPYQRQFGMALVEAGSAAVIGNHAHELHGVEFVNGAPIAYCLGNFWIDGLSDYDWMGRESVVLKLALSDRGVTRILADPLMLDDDGLPRPDESGQTLQLLARHCEPFGLTIQADRRLVAE